MKVIAVILLSSFSLSAQASMVKKFGDKMQCGLVLLAPAKLQAYCYQGNVVRFNSIYYAAPAVLIDYRYSTTNDIKTWSYITWLVRLAPDGSISYEFAVDASMPTEKGVLR